MCERKRERTSERVRKAERDGASEEKVGRKDKREKRREAEVYTPRGQTCTLVYAGSCVSLSCFVLLLSFVRERALDELRSLVPVDGIRLRDPL